MSQTPNPWLDVYPESGCPKACPAVALSPMGAHVQCHAGMLGPSTGCHCGAAFASYDDLVRYNAGDTYTVVYPSGSRAMRWQGAASIRGGRVAGDPSKTNMDEVRATCEQVGERRNLIDRFDGLGKTEVVTRIYARDTETVSGDAAKITE